MDYKELLIKYMMKICDAEGISYVENLESGNEFGISEEDRQELLRLEKEAWKKLRENQQKDNFLSVNL